MPNSIKQRNHHRAVMCDSMQNCRGAALYNAPTRSVPAFDVHTNIEKKKPSLNADKGAAAAKITRECRDSIVGETADLNGPYGAQ